jgi:hypothetical protein
MDLASVNIGTTLASVISWHDSLVGMILAYVDSVYIEQANVFLLGIGMYSCLEWVDVWVYIGAYW